MYTLYGISILIQLLVWIKYGNKIYFSNDSNYEDRTLVASLMLICQILIAIGLIIEYLP